MAPAAENAGDGYVAVTAACARAASIAAVMAEAEKRSLFLSLPLCSLVSSTFSLPVSLSRSSSVFLGPAAPALYHPHLALNDAETQEYTELVQ